MPPTYPKNVWSHAPPALLLLLLVGCGKEESSEAPTPRGDTSNAPRAAPETTRAAPSPWFVGTFSGAAQLTEEEGALARDERARGESRSKDVKEAPGAPAGVRRLGVELEAVVGADGRARGTCKLLRAPAGASVEEPRQLTLLGQIDGDALRAELAGGSERGVVVLKRESDAFVGSVRVASFDGERIHAGTATLRRQGEEHP